MASPEIPEKRPVVVDLQPGTYFWCACGRSKNQPYCDGSHAGTEFEPVKIEVEEEQKMALCQCKHTGNAPICDGSHKNL